jgi:hypothetical protein
MYVSFSGPRVGGKGWVAKGQHKPHLALIAHENGSFYTSLPEKN